MRELVQDKLASRVGDFTFSALAFRVKVLASLKSLSLDLQNTVAFEASLALIRQGLDVNAKTKAGRTPMHAVAEKGLTSAVALLADARADVCAIDAAGKTPLTLATNEECRNALKALRADGWTPLMIAAEAGDEAKVIELADGSEDVRAANRLLQTPLHLAAHGGHVLAVQALLQAKALVRAVDVDGRTAVDLAAFADAVQCVEILERAGAVRSQFSAPKKGDKVRHMQLQMGVGFVSHSSSGLFFLSIILRWLLSCSCTVPKSAAGCLFDVLSCELVGCCRSVAKLH